ncbi:MAG: flagellar protein [Bradymonadales bacterium]|nr:MAG: flagellar protein [Bradymonadales bacterium]
MADIREVIIASQVSPVKGGAKPKAHQANQGSEAASFDQALRHEELKISKHAQKRLEAREISLSNSDQARLSDAMQKLEQKGARDSLVLMGELALIVNVPNKTVVTALEREQMKEQLFTNIDSTIFVDR